MAKFDRKVERQKNQYNFTTKQVVQVSKWHIFKENFNFKWMNLNIKSLIFLVIDFLIVNFTIIPLLMHCLNNKLGFVIGHGVVTSLLIVITFYFINPEKPTLVQVLIRYLFLALLLVLTSLLSVSILL